MTSSPWRRSTTCIRSKSARCAGVVHGTSAARSSGLTRARTCARNCRVLEPHQDPGDFKADAADDPAANREQEQEQDDEPVLLEDRPDLPGGSRVEKAQQNAVPVERRNRDQ